MSAPTVSLKQVLADPSWFATDFDLRNEVFELCLTTREDIASQAFLDERWNRNGFPVVRVPLSLLTAAQRTNSGTEELRFIWHTGFCCSTLLADVLEFAGKNLSLCEPKILVDVADAKRAYAFSHADLAKLPEIMFGFLARRFQKAEAVTIKPAPAANCLLENIVESSPKRHLLLYSDCSSFIISVARLQARDQYVSGMLATIRRDNVTQEWDAKRIAELSRFQSAALLWHLQLAQLRKQFDSKKMRSLDCDALLSDPVAIMSAVDEFFSLKLGTTEVTRIANGAKFVRNAKSRGEGFSATGRGELHAKVLKDHGVEIEEAVAWSYEAFPETPRNGPPLANALHLPIDKAYHP